MAAPVNESDEVDAKLHQVHYEIVRLQKKCTSRNISDYRIKNAAQSFYPSKEKKRTFSKLFIFVSSILTCLVAVIVYVEPMSRLTTYIQRQVLMTTLPVIDWRSLHRIPCIVSNSYKVNEVQSLQTEDCQNCSSITEVGTITEPDIEVVIEYLDEDVPININYTVSHVNAVTIDDIIKLYLDDDVMRLYTCCEFDSNIEVRRNDHRKFLEDIRNSKITQYYGVWRNCFTEAAKLFRQVYKRPDYLPFSLELVPSNGIFICSDYTNNSLVEVPFIEEVMILLQITGSQSLTLKPRRPCEETCQPIETILSEGSALVITDYYYDIEFRSCDKDTSINVQLGAKWDI
ncbi:hypothetical protein ACF0H5_013001 [Mactra antiquata]